MKLPQDKILHIDTEFKDGKLNVVAEWQGELVRCGGCPNKYWKDFDLFCPYMVGIITPNMYCSKGEREGE